MEGDWWTLLVLRKRAAPNERFLQESYQNIIKCESLDPLTRVMIIMRLKTRFRMEHWIETDEIQCSGMSPAEEAIITSPTNNSSKGLPRTSNSNSRPGTSRGAFLRPATAMKLQMPGTSHIRPTTATAGLPRTARPPTKMNNNFDIQAFPPGTLILSTDDVVDWSRSLECDYFTAAHRAPIAVQLMRYLMDGPEPHWQEALQLSLAILNSFENEKIAEQRNYYAWWQMQAGRCALGLGQLNVAQKYLEASFQPLGSTSLRASLLLSYLNARKQAQSDTTLLERLYKHDLKNIQKYSTDSNIHLLRALSRTSPEMYYPLLYSVDPMCKEAIITVAALAYQNRDELRALRLYQRFIDLQGSNDITVLHNFACIALSTNQVLIALQALNKAHTLLKQLKTEEIDDYLEAELWHLTARLALMMGDLVWAHRAAVMGCVASRYKHASLHLLLSMLACYRFQETVGEQHATIAMAVAEQEQCEDVLDVAKLHVVWYALARGAVDVAVRVASSVEKSDGVWKRLKQAIQSN